MSTQEYYPAYTRNSQLMQAILRQQKCVVHPALWDTPKLMLLDREERHVWQLVEKGHSPEDIALILHFYRYQQPENWDDEWEEAKAKAVDYYYPLLLDIDRVEKALDFLLSEKLISSKHQLPEIYTWPYGFWKLKLQLCPHFASFKNYLSWSFSFLHFSLPSFRFPGFKVRSA